MTLSTFSDLKLPALKELAKTKGITLEKVREFGSGSRSKSWIAALQATISKTVDKAVDTVQNFTDETQDQAVAIVLPVVAIVAPMVEVTQTAIEVATPTVKRAVTVIKRVVTVDNISHALCVSFVMLHFISLLSFEAGKVCGEYYRTIAPLDPYGRVMQITADIGSVIHRADPRSVCVDWEDIDRVSGIAKGVITVGYDVLGIIAVVGPLVTGLIVYKFTSATEYALETVFINSIHYVSIRD
jgi:hypothetical protein